MGFSRARPVRVTGVGIVLLVAAFCSLLAAAAPNSRRPARLRLKVEEFDPVAARSHLPARLRHRSEPERGYFVAHFSVPITAALLEKLRARGVRPVEYLPDRSYVVKLPPGAKSALRGMAEVSWLGAVEPGWKIAPDLGSRPFTDPARRAGGKLYATIDLFPGEDLPRVEAELAQLGIQVIQTFHYSDTRRLKVRATEEQIERAARLEAVGWIAEFGEITQRNNTTRWVIQTDVTNSTTIWDHGLHGEGQIIGHIDGRLDMSSCFFEDPIDNTPGPGHRKVVAYRSTSGQGAEPHGTHTAGTAAGDQFPLNGTLDNNGHAYAARISHANSADIDGVGNTASNLYEYLALAYGDGARTHTNSWGDDGTTSYTTWCRDIDLFSYDFEDSLVLFASTNTSSLKTPENAKNVLAVGATQPGASDDAFCSGGAGPTNDGRRKPEIFAPGCSIFSARSGSACDDRSLSGTSMASPAVAGAGALVRQYFEEGWYPTGTKQAADARTPSGALVKAILLVSTEDMTGVGGYPSNEEGWGRVLLENSLYFDGDAQNLVALADLRNVNGLSTGEEDNFALLVNGNTERLKVALVFTDAPASLLANPARVNDLDLELTSPTGLVYKGNVFLNGSSTIGGSADGDNNVEIVQLPSPELGEWLLSVKGTAVNQGKQGYALVAVGEIEAAGGGSLRYAGHTIDDGGPLANGDGGADPGETVVVPLTLLNLRPTSAVSVSAMVRSGDPSQAKVTADTATYPDIDSNDLQGSNAPHYTVTIAPDTPCGSVIPMDVFATHAEGTNESSFSLQVGRTTLDVDSTDVPKILPTFSGSPTTSTIEITDSVTLADVKVAVNIQHENIAELNVKLISPDGTNVTLHDNSGEGVVNLDVVYGSGAQVADGPGSMSDYVGESSDGTWTLSILDQTTGFPSITPPGTLVAWSLDLTASSGAVCNPLSCPGDPVPAEVGQDLTLDKVNGTDIRFQWSAVGGASGYRVWEAGQATFGSEALVGTSGTTTLDDAGALGIPSTLYYQVRAVNSCEWEGP